MSAATGLASDRNSALFIVLVIAVIAAVYVRIPVDPNILINVDELIPLAVSEAMDRRGVLDPNWVHADLPEYFKYDQYNFYLYNIVSHISIKTFGYLGIEPLIALRLTNLILQVLAIFIFCDALRRIGVGGTAIVYAAFLLGLAPTLVHDSHMARPESFLYLLTTVGIWIYANNFNQWRSLILFSMLIGVGAAVKFTFFIAALPLVVVFIHRYGFSVKSIVVWAVSAAAISIATFALVAPFVFINFDAFLNGIEYLSNQYSGSHPPHTTINGHNFSYLFWIMRFFFETYFPQVALITISIFLVAKNRLVIMTAIAPFVLLVIYFSTKTVFFERNFAHVLPLVFFASVLGFNDIVERLSYRIPNITKDVLGAYLTLFSVIPLAWVSVVIFQSAHTEVRTRAEFMSQYPGYSILPSGVSLTLSAPPECGQLAVIEYDNKRAARYRQIMAEAGFAPVAHYKGPFEGRATSTMQSYLGYSMRFYRKACAGET